MLESDWSIKSAIILNIYIMVGHVMKLDIDIQNIYTMTGMTMQSPWCADHIFANSD